MQYTHQLYTPMPLEKRNCIALTMYVLRYCGDNNKLLLSLADVFKSSARYSFDATRERAFAETDVCRSACALSGGPSRARQELRRRRFFGLGLFSYSLSRRRFFSARSQTDRARRVHSYDPWCSIVVAIRLCCAGKRFVNAVPTAV